MNIKKIITLVILYFICFIDINSKETATIKIINELDSQTPISKNANGGFIEFLLDYTNGYGGMWAQEIYDRGFDFIKSDKHKYWSYWYDTKGEFDFIKYIYGGYNENGKYGIEISGNGIIESAIYQKIYIENNISHTFYIYVKNNNASGVAKFVAFDSNFTTRLFEKELDISSSEWKKIEFEVPAIKTHYSINFAITYKGTGSIEIDETSFMPTNNELGIRKEYADLFRIWKPGIIRYPGGGFADLENTYWQAAITHIDKRFAPHFDQVGNLQRMDMGTDEFVKICQHFNIEPYFVINYNRSINEAINWIEYCNGDTNTAFGNLRKKMGGDPEPYNIKYWEIGNERYLYGILNYIYKYSKFYNAIKAYDSSLRLISNGNSWDNTFDTLMSITAKEHDIYGFHPCGGLNKDTFADDEKTYLSVVSGNYTERKINEYEKKIKEHYPNLKIASTEWWSSYGTIKQNNWLFDTISRNYAIEAALWNAAEYLLYMRKPDIIEFATRTFGLGMFKQGINKNGKKVIWATPSLYAIALASNHRGNFILKNEVNCNTFHLYEIENWVDITPYLDVTTSISKDSLFIAVINRHSRESIATNLMLDMEINGTIGKVYEIYSEHFLDNNNVEEPNKILPTQKEWEISNNYIFPKHSFTILAIPVKGLPDKDSINNIVIYPTPTNNYFNISFNKGTFVNNIEIYNILGEKVFFKNIEEFKNEIIIDNISLPNGIYQIKIKCLNKIYHKNIIVNS